MNVETYQSGRRPITEPSTLAPGSDRPGSYPGSERSKPNRPGGVKRFFVVVNNEWNRETYPDLIGNVYRYRVPAYARLLALDQVMWTGGDFPPNFKRSWGGPGVDFQWRVFHRIRAFIFRDALQDYGALPLRGDWDCQVPRTPVNFGHGRLTGGDMDNVRILWKRATLDAWRACRRGQVL